MSDSKQQSILITGCSQGGAGNALALQFASKGFRVFATARSLKTLTNLQGENIETLTLDVTDGSSIEALAAEISSRTGGSLDILFNNAGTLYEAPAIEADPARVRALFNTNVFGLMEMTTALTPLLLASVSSDFSPIIVNVASVLARVPNPFASAYNASKAAVAAYSDTLRLEVQPLGLKVKTLYMGEVSTPLMAADNINFGPESIYHVVEDSLKARTNTHLAKTMAPAQFAREVADEVLNGRSATIWKGTNAFVVWFLDAVGPRNVFDSTLLKGAGLDKEEAKSSIFKLGQAKAKKDTLGKGRSSQI
jgi:1-acylglycerone phosphate reductase